MISEDQAAAIERFVAKGGTVLGTAMSGLVDETMLVHRGGFPGAGLHRLFGLVAEEVDTLRPEDSQHLKFAADNPLGLSESVQAGPYCHLMRPHTDSDGNAEAEVIASYGEQFYADSAALTRRQHGQARPGGWPATAMKTAPKPSSAPYLTNSRFPASSPSQAPASTPPNALQKTAPATSASPTTSTPQPPAPCHPAATATC